jgi:hypothetical protein
MDGGWEDDGNESADIMETNASTPSDGELFFVVNDL